VSRGDELDRRTDVRSSANLTEIGGFVLTVKLFGIAVVSYARARLEVRNSAGAVQMGARLAAVSFHRTMRAKIRNAHCLARIIRLMSYWLPLTEP
jgi:hypothetical protein